MIRKIKLIILPLVAGATLNAQLINPHHSIPVTPEVSAMAKNVDMPMSYTSGTPQIGLPIYSVKSGSMEIPVSLSYNASGVRVDEAATWVGLGWNLNAGGSVTRVIRGLPDESEFGYINSIPSRKVKYVAALGPEDEERYYIELELMPHNQIDLEPDIFSFSVLGYSGKFYWNQDSSKFILTPYQNIKIEGDWTITLPNGVKCYFGGNSSRLESMKSLITRRYINNVSETGVSGGITNFTTSWMLQSVEDPLGNLITLTYAREEVTEFGRGGEVTHEFSTNNKIQSFYKQEYYKPVLQSISGESCDIFFRRSSVKRLDVASYGDGARSLDTIVIKNKLGQEIKSFYFTYAYTTSSDSIMLLGIEDFTGIARKRLWLKSVIERNGTTSLPPYEFTYSSINLPNRLSASQDYWGYYNGKNNGQFLMPRMPKKIGSLTNTGTISAGLAEGFEAGADRRIDTQFHQAGVLKKIKYPTGGVTEYFYEPNDVLHMYYNADAGVEWPDAVYKTKTFMPLLMESPPYPLYYSDTFRILRPFTKTKITANLPSPCNPFLQDANCRFTIKIRSLPDSALVSTTYTTSAYYVTLPEGKYLVEAIVTGAAEVPSFTVNFEWGEKRDPYNFWVGGLRTRKIVSSDSVGNILSRGFSYTFNSSPTNSSGVLAGFPIHRHVIYTSVTPYVGSIINQFEYIASSITPLTSDGQIVRYQFVNEFYDTARTSFKTEYTYSYDFFASEGSGFGFGTGVNTAAPPTTREWQNNILLRKRAFEKKDGAYRVLSDQWNYYQYYKPIEHLYGLYGIFLRQYHVASEWYVLDSTVTINYAYGNSGQQSSMQTASRHFYNSNFLPAKVRSVDSKGQVIVNRTWYTNDFSNVSGYNINTLLAKNMVTLPVKQETSVNGKKINGSVIKYDAFGLPVEVYVYENATLSDTVAHNPATLPGSNYSLQANAYYDANGNLTQATIKGNDVTTLLWNSSGTYPIAQVKNADSASVAFSSFESDGPGQWSVAGAYSTDNASFTGAKDYVLSAGTITKSGLSAKTYIVSYWKKNATGGSVSVNSVSPMTGSTSNGWTYYEHKIVNPGSGIITVSGTATIDELRLYPEKALMTSYTITAQVGMTSQCDPNNQVIRYQYDGLNRVAIIRDRDNNILKKFCYNYQGQPVDCGNGTVPAWTSTSSVCEQSGGSNTGNLLVTEKDMNPSSATYNQTRTITLTNISACPVCNVGNCSGNDKKCINGVCQTGVIVNEGSVRVSGNTWRCYYHYLWSDGSISITYNYVQTGFCPI